MVILCLDTYPAVAINNVDSAEAIPTIPPRNCDTCYVDMGSTCCLIRFSNAGFTNPNRPTTVLFHCETCFVFLGDGVFRRTALSLR